MNRTYHPAADINVTKNLIGNSKAKYHVSDCSGYAYNKQNDLYPRAMSIGATLYMPAIHPDVRSIISGKKIPNLRSIVLCLEDALHENDVDIAMLSVKSLIHDISLGACANNNIIGAKRGGGPFLFIRPRNIGMARAIAAEPGISVIDGMVVPKISLEATEAWWSIARGIDTLLMPTLETEWVFDQGAVNMFGDMITDLGADRIMTLRFGGNDLLGILGLRRTRGRVSYQTPLLSPMSHVICSMGVKGIPVTAPVYDILDDMETLRKESIQDAEFGFVAKTAVHPDQIKIIEESFRVSEEEVVMAKAIIDAGAKAVFQIGGAMGEPATHQAWAKRIVNRSKIYQATTKSHS